MCNIVWTRVREKLHRLGIDVNGFRIAEPQKELSFPAAGGADRFLDFLEKELFPALDRSYRAVPSRTVVGWSFSGLFAAYAALERPTLFNAYLCISPAVWWDNDLIHRRLQEREIAVPDRMVFTLVTKESGGWVYESTKRLVEYARTNPDVDSEPELFEIEGAGHTRGVAEAINRGLISLFAEYVAHEPTIIRGMQEIGETVSARKAYQDAIEIERKKETPNQVNILAAQEGITRLSERSE